MSFEIKNFWQKEVTEHKECFAETNIKLERPFQEMLGACLNALNNGNKILFFGNGGSASDAQHLATELTVRFTENRRALPALSLTTDTSALTAIGNDFGFDFIFSRQVEALGNEGDVAIGISTSGTSVNILKALTAAREQGLVTVGLTGKDGGKMPEYCDVTLIVPSQITARIQEMHILLGHMLCGAIEQSMGLFDTEERESNEKISIVS